MCFLPAEKVWSMDARRADPGTVSIPAWCIWVLRWQVGLRTSTYQAKLQPDWLLHGQPLNIWLLAQSDFPVLGPLFAHHEVALAMSWAGFLNDLLMAPALLWRKTRPWAYGIVVGFHLVRSVVQYRDVPHHDCGGDGLFEPDWPFESCDTNPSPSLCPALSVSPRGSALVVMTLCAFQGLFPLRSMLWEGPVIWHECGMRFAWR